MMEETAYLRAQMERMSDVAQSQAATLTRVCDLLSQMRASQNETERALVALNEDLKLIIENPQLDEVMHGSE